MFRSVVPQRAHDGLASIAVIWPKAALPNVVFGLPNCGWFRTLNASTRNSVSILPNYVPLITEKSMLNCFGPRRMPRPESP